MGELQSTNVAWDQRFSDPSQFTRVQHQHQSVHPVSSLKPIAELVDIEEIGASHKYMNGTNLQHMTGDWMIMQNRFLVYCVIC
jgi:hypothetical protein